MHSKNTQNEEWRQVIIEGEEWPYEVSSDGIVRRSGAEMGATVGRIMKQIPTKFGYLRVGLWRNNRPRRLLVHRLVAAAFIKNPASKPEVNHLDGNKANNNLRNLEWVTTREQADHKRLVLGHTSIGEKNANARLTEADVLYIREFKGTDSALRLAGKFGIDPKHVQRIQDGKFWAHL